MSYYTVLTAVTGLKRSKILAILVIYIFREREREKEESSNFCREIIEDTDLVNDAVRRAYSREIRKKWTRILKL